MGLVRPRLQVVYLSDVSRVPPETLEWLAKRPIAVLVVDAMYKDKPHPTHFSLPEALDLVRSVKPKRAILVGMSDDIEYNAVRAGLPERYVVCGDGLRKPRRRRRRARKRSLHLPVWSRTTCGEGGGWTERGVWQAERVAADPTALCGRSGN